MIIHHRIVDTFYSVRNSLKNKTEFDIPWAAGIQNVLPTNVLDLLNDYYDTTDQWKAEPQGEMHAMEGGDCGGDAAVPRRSLIWVPDTVLEEIHQAFGMAADSVGLLWNKNLELMSVNFWEDEPGFTFSPHVDIEFISATIQVYLNDSAETAGTEFFNENDELLHKMPWVKNTGYVLNSVPTSRHGMTTPSPKRRRSLYAIYKDA